MADASSPPNVDDLLQHAQWVRRLALSLCPDVHAAEDAVQDAWAAVLRRPPRHRENLAGFFARLLRNALGQRARGDVRRAARERAVAGTPGAAFAEAAGDAVQRAELHRALVDLVLQLPEPQQALVLMHYFDGHPIDELARRLRLSPDAVRSHLHRARERLRARLERVDRGVQRGLALLWAARHAAPSVPLATPAAATAAALCMSSLKTKLLVCGVAAAAAVAVWVELPAAPVGATAAPGVPNAAAPAVAALDAKAPDAPSPVVRQQPTTVATARNERVVRCRLVGLHGEAPWTAPVVVTIEGNVVPGANATPRNMQQPAVQVQPDAEGRFAVPLPAWATSCSELVANFTAEDPLYLGFDVHERASSLAESRLAGPGDYELRVHATAVMCGRVVDGDAAPVPAAKIAAFAMGDGLPRDPCLAAASTNDAGEYVLRIPAATDVLLVAMAMHEAVRDGARIVQKDGAIATSNMVRSELLPACVQRRARFLAREQVPALVLAASALVDGTVVFPDGRPAPDITVSLSCVGDATVSASPLAVVWWRDDSCAPLPFAVTDELGRFELRGDPRRSAVVAIGPGPDRPTQKPIERAVTPPAHVEIRLDGRLVQVRSRIDGRPASVSFVAGDGRTMGLMGTNERGEMTMLVPEGQAFCLRTLENGCTVCEKKLEAGQPLPELIEIDLQHLLTVPVTVELEDAIAAGGAQFEWLLAGGSRFGHEVRFAVRGADGLFHFDVPPGRHRLRIRGTRDGPGMDEFLIASEHEVEVPPAGAALRVPTAHGGRIRIEVVDARGLRVPGAVKLVDPSGRESAPLFRGRQDGTERPGVLLEQKASETYDNLPVGRYELAVDLGARGVHRRSVDVRIGVVADVRIELP
ncbi:MAG TPA: sigma-70 family RNA polymerase sigma factor [Planctomycetota bacterium]